MNKMLRVSRRLRSAALSTSALSLCAMGALASFATPLAAAAQSAPDTSLGQNAIWTLQDENSSITTSFPHDRYYVNGFHLGWTSPEGAVPGVLANAGHALFGDGTQRISLGITQQIFTPFATTYINPLPGDEPYAGYLALNVDLIQDTPTTRTVVGGAFGVVGPDAGGELVQNNFHSIIGQGGSHGWAYQLPNEPAIDFFGAQTWRFNTGTLFGLETDVLPQISGMAGLTQDYAEPAIGWRIGQGLDADYGAPLLQPGPSGGEAYTQVRPLVWYIFGDAATKFVAHDEFLEGSDFQSSRGVAVTRVVGTVELGAAVIWRGFRFSYTQVFQTSRYHRELRDLHEYGSFAISGSF